MLAQLVITDFAIIDSLSASFSRGLNILSGETGAGKSIIINAANLILGGRASPDLIRTGAKRAVVEALFPILGQMVKRYVQHEMKLLSEKINNQVNNTFSFKRFFRKTKSKASGINESDLILQEQTNTKIEQAIIIEIGSGLVLAEFSKNKMADEDMVAGMLTAIKSFVEDAFKKEGQNLQYIEYDLYHIHLQNFSSFYIAIVVSGAYNIVYKDKLEDKILKFASNQKVISTLKNKSLLTKKLEDFFKNEGI